MCHTKFIFSQILFLGIVLSALIVPRSSCGQTTIEKMILDSITKYDGAQNEVVRLSDSSFLKNGSSLYIFKANNQKNALAGINDTTVLVFKKISGKWNLASHVNLEYMPIATLTLVDLNGDSLNDIRLSYPVMRGNCVCVVLLFDNKKREFCHNKEFDLFNVGYVPESKQLRSSGLGGLWDNNKAIYRVSKNNHLTLVQSASEEISSSENYGEIKIKTRNKNGNYTTKLIKSTANKTAETFDTLLWSDYLKYFDSGQDL